MCCSLPGWAGGGRVAEFKAAYAAEQEETC